MSPMVRPISPSPRPDKVSPVRFPMFPRVGPAAPEVSAGGGIAERLLALLTSSAVRKGSLEQMQFRRCRPSLLCALDRCVRADQPVQLTLMGFPFKAPNPAKTGPRRLPDLAELAALLRLRQLHLKAKLIYPPGVEIHLIHDGAYIAAVFGVPLEEVRGYESYFSRLVASVNALQPERFLREHDFQALSRPGPGGPARQAPGTREWMRRWRRYARDAGACASRFGKTLGMLNLRGLPLPEACRLLDCAAGGELPPAYARLDQQVRIAMARYSLRDSLLHAFDPRPARFPDAIHLTTQCRPGRLAVWMVQRGQSLLPWHGVGVIDRAGKWKVAPARDVVANPSFRPVFLAQEDTPFFYREAG